MEFISNLIELFLHLDEYLAQVISQYGVWTYAILFIIIFCETGLVFTPFLPGDSLLFAAGAFAALGALELWILIPLLIVAAILGDTVNYWIGHWFGMRLFTGKIPFLKKEYVARTHRFYEKYGGKTIIIARFVPIIRTFAPFVAGIGAMNYPRFITYNVVGGVAWVLIFTLAGYFFGNLPFVKNNFEIVIFAIIGISLVPPIWEAIAERWRKSHGDQAEAPATVRAEPASGVQPESQN